MLQGDSFTELETKASQDRLWLHGGYADGGVLKKTAYPQLWAVEVKLTASPSHEDMARLNKTADMIKEAHRFLVSKAKQASGSKNMVSCDLTNFMERLKILEQ